MTTKLWSKLHRMTVMTDIVERLRDEAFGGKPDAPCITKVRYLEKAADEIEKQRWQLDNALRKRNELETEIERLRTALRAIAEETRKALDND